MYLRRDLKDEFTLARGGGECEQQEGAACERPEGEAGCAKLSICLIPFVHLEHECGRGPSGLVFNFLNEGVPEFKAYQDSYGL